MIRHKTLLTQDKSVLVIIHVKRWQHCGNLEKIKENVETNSTNCSALLKLPYCHQYWYKEQVPLSGQNGAMKISFILVRIYIFWRKMSWERNRESAAPCCRVLDNISLHSVQCGWAGVWCAISAGLVWWWHDDSRYDDTDLWHRGWIWQPPAQTRLLLAIRSFKRRFVNIS